MNTLRFWKNQADFCGLGNPSGILRVEFQLDNLLLNEFSQICLRSSPRRKCFHINKCPFFTALLMQYKREYASCNLISSWHIFIYKKMVSCVAWIGNHFHVFYISLSFPGQQRGPENNPSLWLFFPTCFTFQLHVINPVPNQGKAEVELGGLLVVHVPPEVHPLAKRQDHILYKLES